MYLASHPKSSLENIQPDTYTDVIVMVGINNVKCPGLEEWQDKKVSDKLVIQSYRLTITSSLDLITSSTFYTLKLVNWLTLLQIILTAIISGSWRPLLKLERA